MVGIMNVVGYPLGWKLVVEEGSSSEGRMPAFNLGRARQLHQRLLCAYQCTSTLVKHIDAPVELVWSFVRRFDEPQKYKPFVNQCVVWGGLVIGSVREISLKSGLPATRTTEVLERLDDIERALGIRTIGGDHILTNYSSLVTVHPNRLDGRPGTTVIESFVVDVPEDKTEDDICYFVEAVIKTNLNSLAELSERLARQRQ